MDGNQFYPIAGGKDGTELVGAVTKDITDLKRAKILLERNETRYTKVFEKLKDGICFCEIRPGQKGKNIVLIRDSNPAFGRLLGTTAEEMAGKKINDILPELNQFQFVENELIGPFEINRPIRGNTSTRIFSPSRKTVSC